jgi:hypothetical protein
MLVSHGEAKFGIVYATDAKADPKVKVASGAKRHEARDRAVLLFRSDRKDLTYLQTIRSRFCSVLDFARSPRPDENRDL